MDFNTVESPEAQERRKENRLNEIISELRRDEGEIQESLDDFFNSGDMAHVLVKCITDNDYLHLIREMQKLINNHIVIAASEQLTKEIY